MTSDQSSGTNAVVGVAWYSRAAWAQLRALVPDAGRLEDSYEDWLAVHERGLVELRAAGVQPQRVMIDVERFVAWCGTLGLRLDSAARARFAAEELRREYEASRQSARPT